MIESTIDRVCVSIHKYVFSSSIDIENASISLNVDSKKFLFIVIVRFHDKRIWNKIVINNKIEFIWFREQLFVVCIEWIRIRIRVMFEANVEIVYICFTIDVNVYEWSKIDIDFSRFLIIEYVRWKKIVLFVVKLL